MHGTQGISNIRNTVFIVALAFFLSACVSEKEPKSNEQIVSDNRLIGSVGDGPVVGAAISVRGNDGKLLAGIESDANANYYVLVQTKGQNYPLTVDAVGGIDLVTNDSPDFDLVGAVLEPGDLTVANVNPFTTLIVEVARELPGGLTSENILTAESYVTAALSSGLSTLMNEGPMRAGIDDTNISEIVKAAESLAEIVRRTRDLNLMVGQSTSGNQVLRALASDLTDTIVDGLGGARTESRTSAISTIVAVLVYLESMQNELRVNGLDAMAAMDAAIIQVSASTPSKMTGDIVVTSQMINAVRLGLNACLAIDNGPKIEELVAAFNGVQPGMDAALIRTLTPNDYIQTLEALLGMIAGADDSVIDTINTVVRAGLDDPSVNQTPTISGNPARSVVAGSNYLFTPSAADPERDTLTFSITNRPGWASFSTTTGHLSGAPTTGDAGSYNNIVISVTDGEFTPSLPTFSINVAGENSPPSISGSPSMQVNANSSYSFTPVASDPDNDTLSFEVTGLPGWAEFNNSTGSITGMPTDANVGVYNNIQITVSDGSASASLPSFSITVTAVSLGSVTLNWTPPTQNEDGSELIDLDAYRIRWGTVPGSYSNSVLIDNPGLSSYVVDNLVPGTYEFVATSINAAGVESTYSNTATKVVN